MNLFYAPPEQIQGNRIELEGQQARHAAKVLRYGEGDRISVTDGAGFWYDGIVRRVLGEVVLVEITGREQHPPQNPRLTLALGIIKKRDRLEFAVEKAVELGAAEIILYRSDHTVKENIRIDRLESTAVAAMKQSLRVRLPSISLHNSVQEVADRYLSDLGQRMLVAHEKSDSSPGVPDTFKKEQNLLLVVGPEGGLSGDEVEYLQEMGGWLVSLGQYRLRTETAVVALMSQFL
ncbi:MAG: RsmE family RNA methyltransferase [Balneolaceae bacterium]|nr:RsmE family RNA methyltransferase [Balneolaceae bacterium]